MCHELYEEELEELKQLQKVKPLEKTSQEKAPVLEMNAKDICIL